MFLLCWGVLQVLLILSTECYSININCGENTTTTIRISIPLTADGVGDIQVSEYSPIGDNLEVNVDLGTEYDGYAEDIAAEDDVAAEDNIAAEDSGVLDGVAKDDYGYPDDSAVNPDVPVVNEVVFGGPVRASGNLNIVGNFGPTMPGDPSAYPFYRTMPQLYTPSYPPASSFYNPQCEDVINADTRRLLRNLFLLNVAHQSNIPCEVVPAIPNTNVPVYEPGYESGEIVAGVVPASGKFNIVGNFC